MQRAGARADRRGAGGALTAVVRVQSVSSIRFRISRRSSSIFLLHFFFPILAYRMTTIFVVKTEPRRA